MLFCGICGFIIFERRLCVNGGLAEIRGNSMGANEELEEGGGSTQSISWLESTNRICLHK